MAQTQILHYYCCVAMNNYTYTYTYAYRTWRHNKDERHSSLEKYTSHFIWKGCVWEGVGDRTELQHIDPHSIGHNRISFPFSWAVQPGAWGPTLLGAGFLYRILSPIATAQSVAWGPPLQGSGLLYHILSPTGLIFNWLTSCLPPGYIIIWSRLFFLRASQFRTHSTRPWSRL